MRTFIISYYRNNHAGSSVTMQPCAKAQISRPPASRLMRASIVHIIPHIPCAVTGLRASRLCYVIRRYSAIYAHAKATCRHMRIIRLRCPLSHVNYTTTILVATRALYDCNTHLHTHTPMPMHLARMIRQRALPQPCRCGSALLAFVRRVWSGISSCNTRCGHRT